MIDVDELSAVLNTLGFPINDGEANQMIEFADQDNGRSSSFHTHY